MPALTLSCDDATFCALVEHELSHGGQERDEFGMPRFNNPPARQRLVRGHDMEEFVGANATGTRTWSIPRPNVPPCRLPISVLRAVLPLRVQIRNRELGRSLRFSK
jgi:hypothetical protein